MVLKEPFSTVSILGWFGGLERTDFFTVSTVESIWWSLKN